MGHQKYHILLLCRPGYRRNSFEATLISIENVIVQTAETCDIADQILSKSRVDLFMIYPYMLEAKSIWDVCNRYYKVAKNRVIIFEEPYREKFDLDPLYKDQVFEIETSVQLRNLVLERLC